MRFLLLFFTILCIFSCDKDIGNSCNELSDNIEYNPEINRKVLVIGIDGFRSDVMQQSITPFLYTLSEKENVYYTAAHVVEEYTSSGPNWSSLLTGVHWEKHNVSDNNFVANNYSEYPTFFNYIEDVIGTSGPLTWLEPINTISIVNWTPINEYILSGVVDYSPLEPLSDLEVFESVKDVLVNNDPIAGDVIFVHFDELDGAGHGYGYSADVDEYVSTLGIIDGYIEELFNIIEQKRSTLEDWMIFIVSDHGGDGAGHGDSNNPNINQTIFFAQHPSINFPDNYITSMADLAPTVLDFLGIYSEKFNCKKDGVSLINLSLE